MHVLDLNGEPHRLGRGMSLPTTLPTTLGTPAIFSSGLSISQPQLPVTTGTGATPAQAGNAEAAALSTPPASTTPTDWLETVAKLLPKPTEQTSALSLSALSRLFPPRSTINLLNANEPVSNGTEDVPWEELT